MALKDLVLYSGRRFAQKPNCHSLYELAAKYNLDAEDVSVPDLGAAAP